MIVVDTSALMAIIHEEPAGAPAAALLQNTSEILISANTLAEALIVSRRRGSGEDMSNLILTLNLDVAPVTRDFAVKVADAYDLWGKGVHPAGLNFSDCFAYALAKQENCPLLYVGDDFAKTDIVSALAP